MEIEKTQAIFPTADCQLMPSNDEQYVSFPYGDQWPVLPAEDVSAREIQLLKLISGETTNDKMILADNQQWYRRLFLGPDL